MMAENLDIIILYEDSFLGYFVLNAFFFSERKTGDNEQYKRRGCDVFKQLETLSQMYFLPRRYIANVVIVL
jgi:hypothetical protein